jgi:hypothetical protein
MKVSPFLIALCLLLLIAGGFLLLGRAASLQHEGTAEAAVGDTSLAPKPSSFVPDEKPLPSTIDEQQKQVLDWNLPKITNGLSGYFETHKTPLDTQDRLIALLLLRSQARTKANAELQAGHFSSKETATAWYLAECSRIDSEFSKLLTADELKDFTQSVGRISIRDNFTVAELMLAHADQSLSSQQREAFIDAVYSNYRALNLPLHFTLSQPHSSDEVRAYVRLRAVADGRALRQISPQLNAEQIKIISTYQRNQTNGMVYWWNTKAGQAKLATPPAR